MIWTRRLDLRQPPPLCRRVPDYLGHGVQLISTGVTGWNRTIYRRFTVAGLCHSRSATTWSPDQASNLELAGQEPGL